MSNEESIMKRVKKHATWFLPALAITTYAAYSCTPDDFNDVFGFVPQSTDTKVVSSIEPQSNIEKKDSKELSIKSTNDKNADMWNIFKSNNDSLEVENVKWITESIAFGFKTYKEDKADVFKTEDGGKTWNKISTIEGNNKVNSADLEVSVFGTNDIWYTTAFSGNGYYGTIGKSNDGGKTWIDLTKGLTKFLTGGEDQCKVPLSNIVRTTNAIFVKTNTDFILKSSDDGKSWEKITLPKFDSPSEYQLIGTPDNLLIYSYKNKVNTLHRLQGNIFVESEAKLPNSDDKLWFRYSSNNNGIAFVTKPPYPWWGYPASVLATTDGGKSIKQVFHVASKESEVIGLRDAQVLYKNGKTNVYISGVFKGLDNQEYVQIRHSNDFGDIFKVLHSEKLDKSIREYASISLDIENNIHAMQHKTDSYGNKYSFNGSYILEK